MRTDRGYPEFTYPTPYTRKRLAGQHIPILTRWWMWMFGR